MSRWGERWGGRWGGRWGALSGIVPVVTPSRGGYSFDDLRRYREHLERITKIHDERDRKLYGKKELEEIIEEIVEEIPVKVTEIKKLDDGRRSIDYAALSAEVANIGDWIDLIISRDALLARQAQEMEDEQFL